MKKLKYSFRNATFHLQQFNLQIVLRMQHISLYIPKQPTAVIMAVLNRKRYQERNFILNLDLKKSQETPREMKIARNFSSSTDIFLLSNLIFDEENFSFIVRILEISENVVDKS